MQDLLNLRVPRLGQLSLISGLPVRQTHMLGHFPPVLETELPNTWDSSALIFPLHTRATRALCCRAISRRPSKASSTGKTMKSGCSEAHGAATCWEAKKNWLLQPPCRIQPASWRRANMLPSLTMETTALAGERLSRRSGVSRISILAPVTGHWETILAALLTNTGSYISSTT